MNAQQVVDLLVQQRNGTVVNIDGADAGQCTAIVHCENVMIGYPLLMGNACDYPKTGPASGLYTFIANTPTNAPMVGDVMVYLPNNAAIGTGPYGHTGVVVASNVDSFDSFEQNDEPNVAAHVQARPNYEGVWGWLHPVKLQQAPTAPAPPPITMATVTATAGVWLHTGPGVSSPHAVGQDANGHPISILPYQATFQVAEIVQGEVVNGNNQWAKTVHGNFVTMAYLSISEQGGTKAFLAKVGDLLRKR